MPKGGSITAVSATSRGTGEDTMTHGRNWSLLWLALSGASFLGSCSMAKRPVLYPNPHLNSVGPAVAQADIDACLKLAAQYPGLAGPAGPAARSTATGAVGGAAVGTAVGAVRGNVGTTAAAGAAGGAAAGAAKSLIIDVPDEATRRFVEQCLRDKGYQPIGWQ